MLTEQEMLIAAINSQPEEDTTRLVYADWLDENNCSRQAEFIRTQIALAQPAPVKPKCSPLGVMLRIAIPFFGAVSATAKLDQYKKDLETWTHDRAAYNLLPKREKELWRTKDWTTKPEGLEYIQTEMLSDRYVEGWHEPGHLTQEFFFDVVYERGFPGTLYCYTEGFVKYAKAIFTLNPITTVSLVHKTPIDGKCWFNADAPKSLSSRFRPSRLTLEQTKQGSLPKEIFRLLPGVAAYANWTTYKNVNEALNALNIACLTYGRAKSQPVETTL